MTNINTKPSFIYVFILLFYLNVTRYNYYLMAIPLKYYRWMRNALIGTMFVAPVMGYLYVSSKMRQMEKGIEDDLKRIESKGKSLSDIPRKEWTGSDLLMFVGHPTFLGNI